VRCDEARAVLSAALDGEVAPDAAAGARSHLAGCPECQTHIDAWERVRRELLAVDDRPDLVAGVLDRIAHQPSRRTTVRRTLPLVAAAVAGLIVGATLVSARPGRGPDLVGADIPRRVLAAQSRIDSLEAQVEITERGWHPSVPVRRFTGALVYVAPETMILHLADRTEYPAGQWVPNNVDVVVDRSMWWARGPAPCPTEAQPRCTPTEPRVRVVTGREPFAEDLPAPLDLVLPASGFAIGTDALVLERERDFDGRPATGVVTTAAQIGALLDALHVAGNWRPVPPTAGVTLWLDKERLVPVGVDVDEVSGRGAPALEIRLRGAAPLARPQDAAVPTPPAAPVVRDAGFRDGEEAGPTPSWLPAGMQPYRNGAAGPVAAASWSDGRAWVKVRATEAWPGGRLFGGLGEIVRTVPLPGQGIGYVGEGGRKVAVHGAGVDLVVTGSIPSPDLVRVAASLGVRGEPVPSDWVEASTATLATARAALAPLLVLRGSKNYASPSIRVEDDTVTLAYAGAGDRGFVLVQSPGTALAPPFDADVIGVRVRGRVGRWTPDTHTLEWLERGHLIEMRSRTLRLAELVDAAHQLRVAR
jgi:hypothetical protein